MSWLGAAVSHAQLSIINQFSVNFDVMIHIRTLCMWFTLHTSSPSIRVMLIMAAAVTLSKYVLMLFLLATLFITQVEMFSEGGDVDQYYVSASKPTTATISKKIIVSKEPGYGNYTTIQAAVDQGVPENNAQWIHIFVTAGFYG
ncbi:hypothetical protein Sjap_007268 [Stephania japonica]|uniref:Pectinesterase n=1 Tax=Stephania japonica TaxID=461633 RepID=A0AAP0PB49_9MAGN